MSISARVSRYEYQAVKDGVRVLELRGAHEFPGELVVAFLRGPDGSLHQTDVEEERCSGLTQNPVIAIHSHQFLAIGQSGDDVRLAFDDGLIGAVLNHNGTVALHFWRKRDELPTTDYIRGTPRGF